MSPSILFPVEVDFRTARDVLATINFSIAGKIWLYKSKLQNNQILVHLLDQINFLPL